jgi:hypothetical protein
MEGSPQPQPPHEYLSLNFHFLSLNKNFGMHFPSSILKKNRKIQFEVVIQGKNKLENAFRSFYLRAKVETRGEGKSHGVERNFPLYVWPIGRG